jgi:hypothetical protein
MTKPTPIQTPNRPSRALHLVDIENLAATASVSLQVARRTASEYLSAAQYNVGDLIVVASSHRNGLAARAAFPGATVRWRSGQDGADIALLDAYCEFDHLRFNRLVVGSGDGIFARLVGSARQDGLTVSVVTHRHTASVALRDAASSVALLGQAA